jgi:hypothetical protein
MDEIADVEAWENVEVKAAHPDRDRRVDGSISRLPARAVAVAATGRILLITRSTSAHVGPPGPPKQPEQPIVARGACGRVVADQSAAFTRSPLMTRANRRPIL